MNTRSVLCRFLAAHPNNWMTLLTKEYDIRVKQEGCYAIFNYGHSCDYADPVVQEARGIILDLETLEVVCWPFRKFGNHNESYADPIDWTHARVLEKVDGSIIKLWFDRWGDHWQFSTNGTIRAENAPIGEFTRLTFDAVIRRADNFGDIPFDTLDRDCTYVFELVSPDTQVVVSYPSTTLYHIGTRHNITGRESEMDIGIRKPAAYPIHSLAQCIEAAIRLNRDAAEEVAAEGFVVVDQNWNRVKVKSPDYIMRHRLTQLKAIPKPDCIRMLLEQPRQAQLLCQANPELIPAVKFYDYHLARLRLQADRLGILARQLYEEYSCDRAAVAKVIGRHPLAWIGFQCLTRETRGSELIASLPQDRLCRLIPDYQEDDLSSLFLQGD